MIGARETNPLNEREGNQNASSMGVKSFHLIWGHKGFERHQVINSLMEGRRSRLWNLALETAKRKPTPEGTVITGRPGAGQTPREPQVFLLKLPC